jgi:glutamate 5-kinase
MASKLAAAKIAAWSGVRTVIAAAGRDRVLVDSLDGVAGVGTVVLPHEQNLPARKLWIAFAIGAAGTLVVDEGARNALSRGGASLLAAGVVDAAGDFDADEAVEISTPDGAVFAKGIVRVDLATAKAIAGKRSADLPDGVPRYVVHRDDMVLLPR